MYRVIALYKKPYNSEKPVVCMDEKSTQLLEDTRTSIPMKPGRVKRADHEYKRQGVRNIFVAVEPLAGTRFTKVTKRRTFGDTAYFFKKLANRYPKAKKIQLVLDNLNTHFEKSFTETFSYDEAKRILDKINFIYTPSHGSWLNMAEIEIGILQRQCLKKRMKDESALKDEVRHWQKPRNKSKSKIVWKFTRQDADKKLGKHYSDRKSVV